MRRLWLAAALMAPACADEIPEDVSVQMEAARAATEAERDTVPAVDVGALIRTAPPGGQADWVRDIRTGLDTVPALAALDRGEALHAVQELYTRRFEALRQFYGEGGAIDAGGAVASAIGTAGARLQQLMRELASTAADTTAIDQSVRDTQDALEQIEAAARAAGLPPTAPRDVMTTIS
jgi:hypothetical protein